MQDIDPEKRTDLLETAALEGEQTINGLALRPMTYGTYSLLQRVKHAAGDTDASDLTFAVAAAVFIHSQPLDKLRASYGRPADMIVEIFDFMNERSPSDFGAWVAWVGNQMEQFRASLVQTFAPGGSSDDPSPKA